MSKRASQPARPAKECTVSSTEWHGPTFAYHTGMTLREEFAMAAMNGLCVSISGRSITGNDIAEITACAVMMADSLLEELAKPRNNNEPV